MSTDDCLFCRIARGEVPAETVHSDEHVVAFKDIQPQAPVHLLIIPRRHIATAADVSEADVETFGRMHLVARRLAEEFGIADSGFRTVINCREDGLQTVFHVHMHLLGGRKMGWPPG